MTSEIEHPPADDYVRRMPSKYESQSDLFGEPELSTLRAPVGLGYQSAFVSADEEAELIRRIDAENLSPFRFQQWTGKRLTETYGWRYDFGNGSFGRTKPIPDFLLPIRERAAIFAGLSAAEIEQALLIRYDVGAGIGWHRDRPVFEHVIGISLGSPAPMRFRRRRGNGFARMKVPLEARSIYLMSGEVRHNWEHSIDQVDAPRWSITFRTLSEKGRAKLSVE